jgi:hypothetical protein
MRGSRTLEESGPRRERGSRTSERIRTRTWVLGSLVLPVAIAACGGPNRGAAYDRAYARAARAEGAGRLDEALGEYDRAAALAMRARDQQLARWAAVDVLVRAGRLADAVMRLDAMASASGEYQADAAYRACVLRIEHGDAARGWQAMEQIPRRFPSHGVSHVAVRRLVAHADEQGTRTGLDELAALERDAGTTELGELLAFLSAEHREALGEDVAARDAYLRIADRWPYPGGAFFDDVLWHASLLDEKLGRAQAAADDLERLVAQRETTSIMGSYERAKYVPAMLRLGELYAGALHDRAKARETYHHLYTEYTKSTRRDAALWREAALWRQDGDLKTACDRLGVLVREFPDSRYVPCAIGVCRDLRRPERSVAPKECREYLERREGPARSKRADPNENEGAP